MEMAAKAKAAKAKAKAAEAKKRTAKAKARIKAIAVAKMNDETKIVETIAYVAPTTIGGTPTAEVADLPIVDDYADTDTDVSSLTDTESTTTHEIGILSDILSFQVVLREILREILRRIFSVCQHYISIFLHTILMMIER
jgi:hypothetical protein